jgi:hypothetical protein
VGQDGEKENQKETTKGVIGATTISWVWFDKMNQILEGTAKANDTPSGLD